jgi:hypothetical protein
LLLLVRNRSSNYPLLINTVPAIVSFGACLVRRHAQLTRSYVIVNAPSRKRSVMAISAGYPCAQDYPFRSSGWFARAARLLVLLATTALPLLLGNAPLRADDTRGMGSANAYDLSESRPVDDRGVPTTLDELEREVGAMAAGEADPNTLAKLEADANDALKRAATASDRIRARLLIRRVARLAGREVPLELPAADAGAATAGSAGSRPLDGLVVLAQYVAPGAVAPTVVPAVPPYTIPPSGAAGAPCLTPCVPPPTRHYISVDALGFWVKQDQLPPLVTTSPIGTPQATAGVLGLPTTSVLFGDQGVNGGIRPGARVQGGVWVDALQSFAVEAQYYGLVTETTNFDATSIFSTGSTDPILARPFFNNAPGVNQQQAVLTAFPNFSVPPLVVNVDGSIHISESSSIQSAAGGGRMSLNAYDSPTRLYFMAAYRYFNLNETLSIVSTSTPGTNPFPFPVPAGRVESFDQFATKNIFNGGEVGLAAEMGRSRWKLSAETRLAMGDMQQKIMIDGRTSAISGGFAASFPGGLLAQPTNIGSFSRDRFALIPQLDVKLGYQLLPALRLTVGYNFTYVTSVVRPGDQVDTNVNTTQIAGQPLVGPPSPQLSFNDTGLWLQGITAGMDLRF